MTQEPHFHVRIDPTASLLHIEISLAIEDGDTFFLPVWIPGSYLIREFERAIQDLRIESLSDAKVRLSREDKTTWRIHARSEEHTSELQSRGHLVCRLLLEK